MEALHGLVDCSSTTSHKSISGRAWVISCRVGTNFKRCFRAVLFIEPIS